VKILVLGAAGMMGHMACRVLSENHQVTGTIRGELSPDAPLGHLVARDRILDDVDVLDPVALDRAIASTEPDVVLNCVGIVKQLAAAKDAIASIECNSLLPHRLAVVCRENGARLVHLSTDCVFSGREGGYGLDTIPDPVDLYGRSKLLGETSVEEGLTIRTSIVGRQLSGASSFFEWILSNRGGRVRGFEKAIYTGLTTMALSRLIERVLVEQPSLSGVWQVASAPVTKLDLIRRLDALLGLGLEIEPDTDFECDRSLDGTGFEAVTGLRVPSWDAMLADFAADQGAYAWRDGGQLA
jgi:dTDP-4-dehydrorhamnose reductase